MVSNKIKRILTSNIQTLGIDKRLIEGTEAKKCKSAQWYRTQALTASYVGRSTVSFLRTDNELQMRKLFYDIKNVLQGRSMIRMNKSFAGRHESNIKNNQDISEIEKKTCKTAQWCRTQDLAASYIGCTRLSFLCTDWDFGLKIHSNRIESKQKATSKQEHTFVNMTMQLL